MVYETLNFSVVWQSYDNFMKVHMQWVNRYSSIDLSFRLVIKSDTDGTKVGIIEARGVLKPPTGSATA